MRFLLALLLACRLGCAAAQGDPLARWIDVHLHLVAGRTQDYAGAADAALADMDRFGIATAVVLPPPQIDAQGPYDHAAFVAALKTHGTRFAWLGGGGVLNAILHRHADPSSLGDAEVRAFVAEAERILDAGASGIGEIAALHVSARPGHPYEYVPADHPLLLALADVAARRGAPIDLHMDATLGEQPTPTRLSGDNPPRLPATIAALSRLLAHNPKATIVWAHAGSDPLGGMSAATLHRMMDAHPNLHASLRIFGPEAPFQNKALVASGLDAEWGELFARHPDRFVIGTDSFMLSPSLRGATAGPAVSFAARNEPKLRATRHLIGLLPPETARKIALENAVRLYRLPRR